MPSITLPPLDESIDFIRSLRKATVRDVLAKSRDTQTIALQPRSGVGAHDKMSALLAEMDGAQVPHILSMTIDSYTRLGQFERAHRVLSQAPDRLNGYPLVAHGWERGRALNQLTTKPIEVRHGSPDPRALFDFTIASGITSFEGGGLGYNIPYCQDVPLADSLHFWNEVDLLCGELARQNIIVDREFFGTLTAVLMPPCISIACVIIEAILAQRAGAKCLTLALPQSGNPEQDIAALQVVRRLAEHFLPNFPDLYVALHQFMGVFPASKVDAEAIIILGALVAKKGGADKVITKTSQEAFGIPTVEANLEGVSISNIANSLLVDRISFNADLIAEEEELIEGETTDLLSSVISYNDLAVGVSKAFDGGLLDVPFSANSLIRSEVLPIRDSRGAVRIVEYGNLCIGDKWKEMNRRRIESLSAMNGSRYRMLRASIMHFASPRRPL